MISISHVTTISLAPARRWSAYISGNGFSPARIVQVETVVVGVWSLDPVCPEQRARRVLDQLERRDHLRYDRGDHHGQGHGQGGPGLGQVGAVLRLVR